MDERMAGQQDALSSNAASVKRPSSLVDGR